MNGIYCGNCGIDLSSFPASASAHTCAVTHTATALCWCQPVTTYEDRVTGDRVFVHRSKFDQAALTKEIRRDP